jgi:hypothetical protein
LRVALERQWLVYNEFADSKLALLAQMRSKFRGLEPVLRGGRTV